MTNTQILSPSMSLPFSRTSAYTRSFISENYHQVIVVLLLNGIEMEWNGIEWNIYVDVSIVLDFFDDQTT